MSKRPPKSLTIEMPQALDRKIFLNLVVKAARREGANIWDEIHPKTSRSRGGPPSSRAMVVKACEDILQNYIKWGTILTYSQAELVEAVARDPKIKSLRIKDETIKRHVKSWLNNWINRFDLWPQSKKKAYADHIVTYYEFLLGNYISRKYVLPWFKKIPGYPDSIEKNGRSLPKELCRKIATAQKKCRQQNVQKEPFLAPAYKKRGLLP